MKVKVLFASAAAFAGLLGTSPANATLQLWADVNGVIITCADNAACDTNPAVGQLSIADQTVGGVQILGVSGIQSFGPNSLNSSTLELINNNPTAVNIQVEFSGINYVPPSTGIAASGAGTFENAVGSNINLNFYADLANTQGAPGTPGTNVASFGTTDTASNPDAFSFNSGVLPFSATNPFSMTLEADGSLAAGGTLVGRTQAILTQAVPEPASIGLFGMGLLGLGLFARKRSAKAVANPA
jgi:hypothetical protein